MTKSIIKMSFEKDNLKILLSLLEYMMKETRNEPNICYMTYYKIESEVYIMAISFDRDLIYESQLKKIITEWYLIEGHHFDDKKGGEA